MAVGKRLSTDEPLTEHDAAERINRRALDLLKILMELETMREAIVASRYNGGAIDMLADEIEKWRQ